MKGDETKERYLQGFQPKEYPRFMKAFHGVHSFYQKELHSIFNSPISDSWRTLLDVGCGPTPGNVFPATRKIDSIVLSDLVPGNREEVEKWIEKAPDALDWSFMSEPLAILEGCKDAKRGAEDIEERTRAAVKKVIHCDVLDPNVLPEEHTEVFDVVLSCLCFGTASRDEETFQRVVRNVSGVIREGGHLIFCAIAGSSQYTFAGVEYRGLCLTEAMVEAALISAGLRVRRWDLLDISSTGGTRFAFVVLAEKV
ncbi:nicotinamide N-methyltransferase [Ixodes scapularis]|uniref:nicotinamide N-methyltransferase n=1 Tax=Ixodes scapularis TaxID=6945 RepID=UPI001A9CE4AB|nr:nicotinamide N-methyltransferase [Ixodes scapularis]